MTNEKAIEILLKEVDGIPSDVWDENADDFADAVQIAVYAIKQIAPIKTGTDNAPSVEIATELQPNCNRIATNCNNDLISREALKEEFRNNCFHNCYYCKLSKWDKKGACYICGLIDNAPNGDKEDLGKWIIHDRENLKFGCNQCGNLANIKSRFCPNCGKRMILTGAQYEKES